MPLNLQCLSGLREGAAQQHLRSQGSREAPGSEQLLEGARLYLPRVLSAPEIVGLFSTRRPSSLPLPAPGASWSTEHVWKGCFSQTLCALPVCPQRWCPRVRMAVWETGGSTIPKDRNRMCSALLSLPRPAPPSPRKGLACHVCEPQAESTCADQAAARFTDGAFGRHCDADRAPLPRHSPSHGRIPTLSPQQDGCRGGTASLVQQCTPP